MIKSIKIHLYSIGGISNSISWESGTKEILKFIIIPCFELYRFQ
jgi:hypothetical protein